MVKKGANGGAVLGMTKGMIRMSAGGAAFTSRLGNKEGLAYRIGKRMSK